MVIVAALYRAYPYFSTPTERAAVGSIVKEKARLNFLLGKVFQAPSLGAESGANEPEENFVIRQGSKFSGAQIVTSHSEGGPRRKLELKLRVLEISEDEEPSRAGSSYAHHLEGWPKAALGQRGRRLVPDRRGR